MKILQRIENVFRPVLSDRAIMKYNRNGVLIDGPLDPVQIQPNSVDLTVSNNYKVIKPNAFISDIPNKYNQLPANDVRVLNAIDPTIAVDYGMASFSDYVVIGPGEFILLASNEVLNIPNGIVAFVQGRSSIARMGIQTEQAGLVDSGFKGTITFEVFNETKYAIKIYRGMRIAQVYFFKSQMSGQVYGKRKGSKYSGQIYATGSKINEDPELRKYYKDRTQEP